MLSILLFLILQCHLCTLDSVSRQFLFSHQPQMGRDQKLKVNAGDLVLASRGPNQNVLLLISGIGSNSLKNSLRKEKDNEKKLFFPYFV